MKVVPLQVAQTGVAVGSTADVRDAQDFGRRSLDTLAVVLRTSAGVSVSIQIEVSVDNVNFVPAAAAFTTVASGTIVNVPRAPYVRANVTATSGVTVNAHAIL